MLKLKIFELNLRKELRQRVQGIAEAVHSQTVLAFNKEHARDLAQDNSGKESLYSKKEFNSEEPWQEEKLTSCQRITMQTDSLGGVISQEVF